MKRRLITAITLLVSLPSLNAAQILTGSGVRLSQIDDLVNLSISDLRYNEVELNGPIVFFEGETVLNTDLTTNTGVVDSGTAVESYYFHFDPIGSTTSTLSVSGNVTFEEEILAIIWTNGFSNSATLLNDSDTIIGVAGVTYEKDSIRGTLEGVSDGGLNYSGNTVTWTNLTSAHSVSDSFRVITASSTASVPEPTSSILLSIGALFTLLRRARK